ncbi:MAG: zinc ribbon domain-containing protein [Ktedonobacteraceae bacterium]
MIRCRQCNSELIEQARFCNVCGLPQDSQENELEHSTRNAEKTLETNMPGNCESCGAEIPNDARFCAICGIARTSRKPSTSEAINNEILPTSTKNNNDNSTVQLQPSKSIKPTQTINTANEQESISSENASIRPKTVARPPVFPSRPTGNSVKPSTNTSLTSTPIPDSNSETQFASTHSNQSSQVQNPSTAISVGSSISTVSSKDENSNISVQTPKELSTPTRTPGLIRPVTPKSSARSIIPTRPDSNGQTVVSPQSTQVSQTPENITYSPPAKVSSSINNQAHTNTSPDFVKSATKSNDKRMMAQPATEQTHAYSQPTVNGKDVHNRPQEQIAGVQTSSVETMWQNSTQYDSDAPVMRSTVARSANGNNGISDTPTMDLLNPASFMATSKAAEQWRKSWRDRQYAEAGPAENVSRGQASVPMPLTPMHQSLVRMRAIQKDDKNSQNKRSAKLGTWITIFLMLCLIIGLGAYLIVSYLPNSPFGVTQVTPPTNIAQPTLVLVGTTSQTITVGTSIQLQGEHFGVNQTIIFLRDTATPIIEKSGNNFSIDTNNQGIFNVTIPIDNNWSVGSHSIEALDKSTNQNAFQTIQVIPTGTATTSSTQLSVSMQGKPASLLTFKTVLDQADPDPQQITITNTSGSNLQWTATAVTNNNLNWLQINDSNDYGQLAISQPHSILISVNTIGLKTADANHPYKGQIIFTINNTQLLTLPVQLQIVDATPEMVFSPNPIVAQSGPGNTCQSIQTNQPLTLSLINLGSAAISWAVNPDLTDKIKFVNNDGQLLESGTLLPSGSLLPSGQPGDTVVLTLQCTNIQHRQSYHVSVYANKLSWSELVIVQ